MVVYAAAIFLSAGAHAQSPAAVTGWIDQQASSGADYGESRFEIVYQRRLYPATSAAQVAALEREVAGKPDHPLHGQLETAKRRLEKPDEIVVHVHWESPVSWRLSTTYKYEDKELPYADFAVTADGAWALTAQQLTIVDPKSFPPNQDYLSLVTEFETVAQDILFGGLSLPKRLGLTRGPVVMNGDKWECTFSNPDRTYTFRGTWDETAARGFVTSYRLVRGPDPAFVGTERVMSGWARHGDLWIAADAIEHRPDGRPTASTKFVSIRPLTKSDFQTATATPKVDGADVLRGPVTVARVYDLRPGRMEASFPTDPERAPVSLEEPGETTSLRRAGWVTAGVLVLVFAGLIGRRLRRSSSVGV